MDWKKESIEQLKEYAQRQEALKNLAERYEGLDYEIAQIQKEAASLTPEKRSRLLSAVAEKEHLRRNYTMTKQMVDLTRKGLSSLNKEQLQVLDGFYIHREMNHAEHLMEKLYVEKSKLYTMKDEALHKFTVTMYGMTES